MLIYCVEDHAEIRDLIVYTLEMAGFFAKGFPDGGAFFKKLDEKKQKPDLILLDMMLPGDDGLKIMSRLKKEMQWKAIPVIFLTAKSAEYDKVQALNAGADDYIVKPFGMMEMIARVNAVLRRAAPTERNSELVWGELKIYPDEMRVFVGELEIQLTPKEFALLLYLAENRGIVLTREKLFLEIWGFDYFGATRTVDVHVRSLRAKLGPVGAQIETVHGIGYRMTKEKKHL